MVFVMSCLVYGADIQCLLMPIRSRVCNQSLDALPRFSLKCFVSTVLKKIHICKVYIIISIIVDIDITLYIL